MEKKTRFTCLKKLDNKQVIMKKIEFKQVLKYEPITLCGSLIVVIPDAHVRHLRYQDLMN